MKVIDIYDYINSFAPFDTALSFDNVGVLVGDKMNRVTRAGICLDITQNTVNLAKKKNCDLIISHHPVIFTKISEITESSPVYKLIQNKISAICAHTNLDIALGGVNDCLLNMLELDKIGTIKEENLDLVRIGTWKKKKTAEQAVKFIKEKLHCQSVKFSERKETIKTVAVCGGAGGELIDAAMKAGVDAFVTSEIKHHEWIKEKREMMLIDAGHFSTEQVVIKPLVEKLSNKFTDIEFIILKESEPYLSM